jgi:hypothetical protein
MWVFAEFRPGLKADISQMERGFWDMGLRGGSERRI